MRLQPLPSRARLLIALLAGLAGCAGVGPDFEPPQADAPADWQSRPGSAPELAGSLEPRTDTLPAQWWTVFRDPTLDALQQRALQASPDLRTAALRFAQSRAQRRIAASQVLPQADLNAQATRQRQSENAAETRLVNAIGGAQAPALVELLSDPFDLYQAGFDVSWELDLWGRVRRSVEAADASIEAAGASLDDARLTLSSELARAYFELRQVQRQEALLARETALADDIASLLQARAAHGLSNQDPPLAQQGRQSGLQARQAALQARRAALMNQIGLLTGDAPGQLNLLLAPPDVALDDTAATMLPDLSLGLPADRVRRRPDVRAAEARLHGATAEIGVAIADLYPRIALGAGAGFQSIASGEFGEWGSRNWQLGPVLSLPLFDRGRRRATVALRELQQQQAAAEWQRSVLAAWQEVDDALNGYAAERLRNQALRSRYAAARQQWELAQARARNGLTDAIAPLRAEQAWRQAQEELVQSDARLQTALVTVYKAVGAGG